MRTRPDQPRRPCGPGGFTLLELVFVMVLITIMLGVAAPSLRGFLTAARSRDAAAQLVAVTQYARARAASDSRVFRLNVDATRGIYWLTAQIGTDFERLGNDFGQEFAIPDGAQLELIPLGDTASLVSGAIDFYADGRSDTAVLRFTDTRGDIHTVACAAPSEPFRVVTAEEAARL